MTDLALEQLQIAHQTGDPAALEIALRRVLAFSDRGEVREISLAAGVPEYRVRNLGKQVKDLQAKQSGKTVVFDGEFADPRVRELAAILCLPWGERSQAKAAFATKHNMSLKTVDIWCTKIRRGIDPSRRQTKATRDQARTLSDEHLVWLIGEFGRCIRSQGGEQPNLSLVHKAFREKFQVDVSYSTVRRGWEEARSKWPFLFETAASAKKRLKFVHEIDYWRPGHIWQADRSRGDLFAIDVENRRIMRPEFVLVNDGGSRADLALGYFPSIDGLTFNGVLASIMLGFLDAEYAHVPEFFYVDNGKVECNRSLQDALSIVGTKLINRPPAEPSYGGLIERAIRDVHESFEATLPFYCGSNNRDDHRPEAFTDLFPDYASFKDRDEQIRQARQRGMLTLDELNDNARAYLLTKNTTPHSYHVDRQKTDIDYPHQTAPHDHLISNLPENQKRVRTEQRRFALRLLPYQERVVRDGKVQVFDMKFTMPGLNTLNGEAVRVYYLPTDLRFVLLFKPAGKAGEYEELGRAEQLHRMVPTNPISIKQIKANKAAAKAPLRMVADLRKKLDDPNYPNAWKMQELENLQATGLALAAEAEARMLGAGDAQPERKALPIVGYLEQDGQSTPIYGEPEEEN